MKLLEQIGDAVDQYSDHWNEEEVNHMAHVVDKLTEILLYLRQKGMYPPPPYRRS